MLGFGWRMGFKALLYSAGIWVVVIGVVVVDAR